MAPTAPQTQLPLAGSIAIVGMACPILRSCGRLWKSKTQVKCCFTSAEVFPTLSAISVLGTLFGRMPSLKLLRRPQTGARLIILACIPLYFGPSLRCFGFSNLVHSKVRVCQFPAIVTIYLSWVSLLIYTPQYYYYCLLASST